ncbi:MAG: hypothetical protein K9K93_01150 [Acholeplasmataceae bacterium]|nr:hypothetical protein [Acholeplasmataceae bacterium]
MEHRLRRRKQFRQRSNMQVIKTLFTSLSMTVGVVFFVVLAIPKSPIATIQNIKVMETAVAYEVSVTDAEDASEPESLVIILKNQFVDYVQPLVVGFNAGLFEGLEPGTTYDMMVVGNKGFGDITLDHTTVQTEGFSGGVIVMRSELITKNDYDYTYVFDVFLGTFEGPISDYVVSYGMIYTHGDNGEQSVFYERVEMTSDRERITWDGVYGYGYQAHIKLERRLNNESDEAVLLDEIYFYAPFEVDASFYVEEVLGHMVTGVLYPVFTRIPEGIFQLTLKSDGLVLRTITITKASLGDSGYMVDFAFDDLDPNQDYAIELSASYVNPDSLKEEHVVLETFEFPAGR